MNIVFKSAKFIFNVLVIFIIFIISLNYLILNTPKFQTIPGTNVLDSSNLVQNITSINNSLKNIIPFKLDNDEVIYNKSDGFNMSSSSILKPSENVESNASRMDILNRAKAMTEVEWTPSYNLTDKYCNYVFIKGKTYHGIPYSMDSFQATSKDSFLSKITGSKTLYGNDCSGFVSAAWGIKRQTTLSLYEAVKYGKKVDNRIVTSIAWEDLKPGDALLLDNGKGKGHIMLFIDIDDTNKDKINVYEQNIITTSPYGSMPVARKEIHSISSLKKEGYIPIRLS